MSAFKITKFLGTSPKIATELLTDTAAQIAKNCKLYSGDLIPYPAPGVAGTTGRVGPVLSIYALRDPVTNAPVWLSWDKDVKVATPATDTLNDQRFYFTGDGKPKVSTYALATSGAPPYPTTAYDLGLELPTVKPTAAATAFAAVASVSFARDAGNNVTLVTASPHNLKSGGLATISGFSYRTGTYTRVGTLITVTLTGHNLVTGASVLLEFTSGTATSSRYTITVVDPNTFTCTDIASGATSGAMRLDIRDLNITSEITVINTTTISYFSAGPQVTTTANTEGLVDLGGQIQARSYVYTWYTPWEEEGIGSDPSDALFIREGQFVTVTNLPTTPPAGNNFVRGIRLYRTLSGTTDADYFRLATLWFPNTVSQVFRATNQSTVKFVHPHNLEVGDRFKISGCSVASFDITGGIVTEVVDQYAIRYAQVAANVTATAATGTLYYDVSENPPTTAARYWGDAGVYSFTDDFSFRSLLNALRSNTYAPPPEDLQGMIVMQNNILVGFVGNELYFTEPGVYHAWPERYIRTVDSPVVGLATYSGNLLVLTENFPYVISGSDPAVLTQTRLSSQYPCLSSRSIVETSFGVVYATHDGLAVYSTSLGTQLLTRLVHSSDTWNADLDPSTIVAATYKDTYFASHATASIIVENSDKGNISFVDSNFSFTAAWYDPVTNYMYVAVGTNGDVYRWDNPSQPNSLMTWKSKTFVALEPTNLGAARVVADYPPASGSPFWDVATPLWNVYTQLWNVTDPLTFKLWVNKQLIHTSTRTDSGVFRLPTGYRSDTFEVGVESTIRVRAIHLGDTPNDLRRA